MTRTTHEPLKVFCSYSHRDEHYLEILKTWLVGLERDGLIEEWHDRMITPGQEWDKTIAENLETSDMVLLLVTPHFMASQYIYEKEISQAVENHSRGKARVVPIMLRPSPPLAGTPFGKLQALPKDGKPITTWANQDQAWLDVLKGIQQAVEELIFKREAPEPEESSEQIYREAVEEAWTDGELHSRKVERLSDLAGEHELSTASASAIEREVMGDTKEAILERQERAAREKERKERLEELYTRARGLHRDQEWQAVIDVFKEIHAEDPVHPDPEELLTSAREALEVVEREQNALRRYHEAVELVWADRELDRREVERLRSLADDLKLSSSSAANTERKVMGGTKEAILDSQERTAREKEQKQQYRRAVEEAWTDHTLSEAKVEQLGTLAFDLGLSTDAAADIERAVMDDTLRAILQRQTRELDERQRYLAGLYDRARALYQEQEWQAVIEVFEQIRSQEPAYLDSEELLKSARDALELRQRVTAVFERGQRHVDAGEWQQALESFEEVQRLDPGYRETERLLSQVRQELKPPQTMEVFLDGLARICAKYEGASYYLDEAITEEKLGNARSRFPIPDTERVVALLDVTRGGSSEYGIAICEEGIRWCNERSSSGGLIYRRWHSTQRGSLLWSEFADAHIEKHSGHNVVPIEIGENNVFFMTRSAMDPDDLVHLLLDLQSYLEAYTQQGFKHSGDAKEKIEELGVDLSQAKGSDTAGPITVEGVESTANHREPSVTEFSVKGAPADRTQQSPLTSTITASNADQIKRLYTLWHTNAVDAVAFSPDGKLLASGSRDATVGLWRVEDGTLLRTLEGHMSLVNTVAFSPDGKLLASASGDRTVRVWRVDDGTQLRILEGHANPVNTVAFSPDGKLLASGSKDTTVGLWRVEDGTLLRTLEGHKKQVNTVAFSPDGELLSSGSGGTLRGDDTVRLWRVEDGTLLRTLEGHMSLVNTVAFSPDGKLLASASRDRTVRVWRVDDGTFIRDLRLLLARGALSNIALSPNGELLASGDEDRTVRLWRVEDGAHLCMLEGHKEHVNAVAFSPDSKLLASGSDDRTVWLWGIVDSSNGPGD